jgi:hypothetical protein
VAAAPAAKRWSNSCASGNFADEEESGTARLKAQVARHARRSQRHE